MFQNLFGNNFSLKIFYWYIFAGQEDATIDYDEGIKITPFNMKEELQTGHFDKQGTFIFDKEVSIVWRLLSNIL